MRPQDHAHFFNSFHTLCRIHAADVVRSLYCILTQGGVLRAVWPEAPDMGLFTALFTAAIHDYEHRGVNNDFLIKSSDDLAVSGTVHLVLYM